MIEPIIGRVRVFPNLLFKYNLIQQLSQPGTT